MIRSVVIFRGHVQGVGFRYNTCRVADNYEITGSVRNLADGSVEIIAEGARAEVDMFIADIAQRMEQFIHKQSRSDSPATGQFTGFAVSY